MSSRSSRSVDKLSKSDRNRLEDSARLRITAAFTAFVAASIDHKIAIRAAIESEQQIRLILAQVAVGTLFPGLRGDLAVLAMGLAQSFRDRSGTTSRNRQLFLRRISQLDPDEARRQFLLATKIEPTPLTVPAGLDTSLRLFGEGDADQFLRDLNKEFQSRIQAIK